MTNRNIVLERAIYRVSETGSETDPEAGPFNEWGAGQMHPASKNARHARQKYARQAEQAQKAAAPQAPAEERQPAQASAARAAAPQAPAEERQPAQASAARAAAPQAPAEERQPARASAARAAEPARSRPKGVPTLEQLEKELKKERRRADFGRVLRNTVFSLVVVAAVSALIAVLFLPVLQIHGTSMAPTLADGDIVAAISVGKCRQGELIAFYYNNNILIKRVIAGPSDWVDIDAEGNVSVNGQPLEEPYLAEKARGNCDVTFPYQVPDGRYFVMGDHRATSVDSRNEVVGCISRDMVIGRILLRVWPLNGFRLF